MKKQANSRIAAEVAQFDAVGDQWWNERGPFGILHRLNPVRMAYLISQVGRPLRGVSVLDIACGGGLVCEPFSRLGGRVTGIDTSENAIAAARAHADGQGLSIEYVCASLEEFSEARSKKQEARKENLASFPLPLDSQFDVITALEILEHVANPMAFVAAAARHLKPRGKIIFSTINRTARSLLLAKIAAEEVLGIVPRGTHNWSQFIQPSELAEMCEATGLKVTDIMGFKMNPVHAGTAIFALSRDVAVNYFLTAYKG